MGMTSSPRCPPGLGPPYVLKALARVPLHKTGLGAVRWGWHRRPSCRPPAPDAGTVRAPGLPIHGYLVEELIPAGTEIIIGSTVDDSFGRVVMVGLGGTLVEATARVAIRLWPISAADAGEMIAGLRAPANCWPPTAMPGPSRARCCAWRGPAGCCRTLMTS